MDRAYVLHTYPYRETSLILQAWTEKHGRVGLVAKGARRPRSASRSLLVPFQPLVIDWFGKGELRTLKTAEPAAPATPLAGLGFEVQDLLHDGYTLTPESVRVHYQNADGATFTLGGTPIAVSLPVGTEAMAPRGSGTTGTYRGSMTLDGTGLTP